MCMAFCFALHDIKRSWDLITLLGFSNFADNIVRYSVDLLYKLVGVLLQELPLIHQYVLDMTHTVHAV